ncbi:basic salivary proline-rich protein 3 isoform X2 [Topomyia yanbarensis]|uniref:basic salivary proline-rich protein 3 isoform X2 n=1 Tax=Topomyia yanbarensis TaxID=2498891 RepID=UPI00273A8882|nr:basic salivary proline-rich protein 3 isoform X2 [Topomyia yanbarensis]
MSAKKYLKTVPSQQPAQPVAKTEKEEQLWNALKRHIMRERERKKQELEAEVEEERLRKEREAREKQDVMTLGETKEQIQMLEKTLQELRNEKQQLFLQLKKVLNEDDNRKRQMKESVEMFAIHNIPQQQIFIPQRNTTAMPPHQQHLIHKANPPVNVVKRTHSPSPQGYYKQPNTNQQYPPPQPQKPQYCPPATLFYPTGAPPQQNPQDNRQPQTQIIYPSYQGNMAPMPIRQPYHVDLPPQQGPPPSTSQKGPDMNKPVQAPPPGNVYHITLDQHGNPQPTQNPGPPPQLKAITIEKIPQDRGVPYHIELKHDDRKDMRQVQQPPPQSSQQTTHLPEGIVYTSALRPGVIPMHAIASNQQMPKGGSITQGYPPVRPPPITNPQQPSQMHYQRHRY